MGPCLHVMRSVLKQNYCEPFLVRLRNPVGAAYDYYLRLHISVCI
jgi:hypothetical protein